MAIFGIGTPAYAETSRVALLTLDPADPLMSRLGAEIRATGFEVTVQRAADVTVTADVLQAAAQTNNAIAAVQVVRRADGVEIWIFDRVTAKAVIRRLGSGGRQNQKGGPNESLIALRAVELLRGSLLEIRATQPPPFELKASPAVEALVDRSLPPPAAAPGQLISLKLTPGLLLSPGGVSQAATGGLELVWWRWAKAAIIANVQIPVTSGRVRAAEGTARVQTTMATTGLRLVRQRPGVQGWTYSGGAAVGALWLRLDGIEAQPGFRVQTSSVAAAVFMGHAEMNYGLNAWVSLVLGVSVGLAGPWPEIRFGPNRRADFGLPLAILATGFEMRLP